MTYVNIIGRLGMGPTIEDISTDIRRWLLCSRDFLRMRTEEAATRIHLATTTPDYTRILDSHPAALAFDGNRQSYLETDGGPLNSVNLILDTGTTARKALLFLEFPDGEEVTVEFIGFSNDPSATFFNLASSLVTLVQGSRWGLYQLPISAYEEQGVFTPTAAFSGVTFNVTPNSSPNDYWNGSTAVPQSGPNQGIVRQILDWTTGTGLTVIDRPWPYAQSASGILYRKPAPQGLANRYVKLQLRSRWHYGTGPLRLISVSLFDYYMELKGDLGGWSRFRAGSPSGRTSDVGNLGTVHELLDGDVEIEQVSGPKRSFGINWDCVPAEYLDYLEQWAGLGKVGLVDHLGQYFQGIVTPLSAQDLLRAVNRAEERQVSMTFREV